MYKERNVVIKVMFYEENGKLYKFKKPVIRNFGNVEVSVEIKDGYIYVSKEGYETEVFKSSFCKIL